MRNNSFGLPESTVDRFLREERERAALFRNALGGNAIADAVKQAKTASEMLRGLDLDAPYRGILDTLERDRRDRESLKHLTSNAWALSVTDTARRFAEQNTSLVEQQRHLASSVLDTVKAFDANKSLVASAIASASAGATYKRMIAEALPRFSTFSAIAERMLVIDTLTLRASVDERETATSFAARRVIEMQRVAVAIATAETDEDTARLQGSLFDLVLSFFQGLGPNTLPELQRMGLVGFISFILTLLGAYALIPQQPTMSPQEKAAFSTLNQKIDHAQAEHHRYHEAAAQSEAAFLAQHARAYLSRDATFRNAPARDGAVVLKAPKGTEIAVEESKGRWRKIMFRDPLSDQLARAWVYSTAVAPLAAPISGGGE
ncbi:hypothetical protein [Sphingobium sp. CECT 9361]|nr:hypothetical protein [Sphingobium sp. CECT 9361]CAH0354440.1 hypothetical protein SPH9361_03025 [Sphingobium sp. CECT 9361]